MTDQDPEYRNKLLRGAIIFVVMSLLGIGVIAAAAIRFFRHGLPAG